MIVKIELWEIAQFRCLVDAEGKAPAVQFGRRAVTRERVWRSQAASPSYLELHQSLTTVRILLEHILAFYLWRNSHVNR